MKTAAPFAGVRASRVPPARRISLPLAVLLLGWGGLGAACNSVSAPRTPFLAMVTGVSMQPVFQPGEPVFVLDHAFDALQPGMTAVFWARRPNAPRTMVIHRVVRRVDADTWITRGVNNPADDDFRLTRLNFVGVVQDRTGPFHPDAPAVQVAAQRGEPDRAGPMQSPSRPPGGG